MEEHAKPMKTPAHAMVLSTAVSAEQEFLTLRDGHIG
jgi:hypothetical protein